MKTDDIKIDKIQIYTAGKKIDGLFARGRFPDFRAITSTVFIKLGFISQWI